MLKETVVWWGEGGVIARELLQEVTLVYKSSRLRSISRPEEEKKDRKCRKYDIMEVSFSFKTATFADKSVEKRRMEMRSRRCTDTQR